MEVRTMSTPPQRLLLVRRHHVDLLRTASAACRAWRRSVRSAPRPGGPPRACSPPTAPVPPCSWRAAGDRDPLPVHREVRVPV